MLALATAGLVADGAVAQRSYVATDTLDGRRAPRDQPREAVDFVREGSRVYVMCQAAGAPTPYGGRIWDLVRPLEQARLAPAHRNRYLYVPDNFIYTGTSGFAPGIPRCQSSSRPAPPTAPPPQAPKPAPPVKDWHGCPPGRLCLYRHAGFGQKLIEAAPATAIPLSMAARGKTSSYVNRTGWTFFCWQSRLIGKRRLFTMRPGAMRSSLGALGDRCHAVTGRDS